MNLWILFRKCKMTLDTGVHDQHTHARGLAQILFGEWWWEWKKKTDETISKLNIRWAIIENYDWQTMKWYKTNEFKSFMFLCYCARISMFLFNVYARANYGHTKCYCEVLLFVTSQENELMQCYKWQWWTKKWQTAKEL
jgi:hypothetical protein